MPSLSPTVERPRDLNAPKRPVRQLTAILSGKGDTKRHALIDDLCTDLSEPIHIGFSGAEITAFDRVIKQSPDTIAVVLVVLRRIDSSLRGNAVCPPRTIVETKALHVIPKLSQGRRRTRAGKAGTDNDHGELPFVVGADQLFAEPVPIPFAFQRSGRNF